jgi:hypothetical protein
MTAPAGFAVTMRVFVQPYGIPNFFGLLCTSGGGAMPIWSRKVLVESLLAR